MTNDEGRIARLEAMMEHHREQIAHHKEEIQCLREIQQQLEKYIAVQEAMNERLTQQHVEAREDRWQVWLRWSITPGLPIAAILGLAWKVFIGDTME